MLLLGSSFPPLPSLTCGPSATQGTVSLGLRSHGGGSQEEGR